MDFEERRRVLKKKGRLSPKEASLFTGIIESRLNKWRGQAGKGPLFYKQGHLIYYFVKDLLAWEESCLKLPGEETVA